MQFPKNTALYRGGSEAQKLTHVFWIKLGRCLVVLSQEPGHFFPQAVDRARETLQLQAQEPKLKFPVCVYIREGEKALL